MGLNLVILELVMGRTVDYLSHLIKRFYDLENITYLDALKNLCYH